MKLIIGLLLVFTISLCNSEETPAARCRQWMGTTWFSFYDTCNQVDCPCFPELVDWAPLPTPDCAACCMSTMIGCNYQIDTLVALENHKKAQNECCRNATSAK
ncbi:hypothetical protein Fcan01_16238 [Folsomia candida]|uniref:Uncharacterized protein n=1 Tax=Folsomia candida TaxID=158441 RepID=A0A226DWS0_FOLCA|nr:hypothetical protein Fcan01_16238 [Folsomia candida]